MASLGLFYRYYFGRCFSELAQLDLLPFSRGRSTRFLSPFLDVTRMSLSTVSFLAQLDSGILSIECFPLTYDLSGFTSRINRHLSTLGSF